MLFARLLSLRRIIGRRICLRGGRISFALRNGLLQAGNLGGLPLVGGEEQPSSSDQDEDENSGQSRSHLFFEQPA
jgi:hypothetical protein